MPQETPPPQAESTGLLDITTPVEETQEVPFQEEASPPSAEEAPKSEGPSFKDFLARKEESHAETAPELIQEHGKPPAEKSKEEAPKPETPLREIKFTARKYDGLTQAEAKLFKNMSNEAYNELYPKYLDYKKLKSAPPPPPPQQQPDGLPPSWYEHEDAIQLTPEFRRASTDRSRFVAEANHWREQIIKIREGEPGVSLAVDEKGELVLGDTIEPNSRNEELIRERLTYVTGQVNNIDGWMNNARGQFRQRHGDVKSRVRKLEATLFPFYEQPGNPHEPLIKRELESYPPEVAGSLLAPLCAKLTVYAKALADRLAALEKKNQIARTVKEDKAIAGPNQTDIGAVAPPTKPTVSFSQMRGLTQD